MAKGMGIGRRVKLRLEELDRNAAWLSLETKRLGQEMSAAAISILIKRDSKRTVFVTVLARALDVSEQWLSSGTGPKLRSIDAEPPPEQISHPAQNLGVLFDHLPPDQQREAWPWLVRMLATSPAMLATYLPFPAQNTRVKAAYGTPGRKAKARQ